MEAPIPVLPGTLDLLILKAVSLSHEHGYGILQRIEHISGGALAIEQGALYPALHRLEHQGFLSAEWGVSGNNRKARFYSLTPSGRKRLQTDSAAWERIVRAMSAALRANAEGMQ